ncbi:FIMAH domain-containing protein [Paenibacillus sp. HJGM_3]|uniref:FIMAH domain-containing protein n=1 Tax=Paenibacillus sp. HJGM_3 TaxID=3379816 RepID=UPI00385BA400
MRKWIRYVLVFCLLCGSVSVAAAEEGSSTSPDYGMLYNFKDLKVTEATQGTRYMPPSELGLTLGALLFRNSVGSGQYVTVAFDVYQADDYEIDLQAYKATSYGTYRIKIDGEPVGERNFYAPSNGPGDFEALKTMHLSQGTHLITFECVGKDKASSSYFVSFMQLMLLNGSDREARFQQITDSIRSAQNALLTVAGKIRASGAAEEQALRGKAEELSSRLHALEEQAGSSKENPSALREVRIEAERISLLIGRLDNIVQARNARPSSAFGLLAADSMSLVYPRDLPCACSAASAMLSLAEGEYESIQAVVLPYGEALQHVSAEIVSIKDPQGKEAAASELHASISPLGSVHVKNTALPALEGRPKGYEGWNPDPIRSDISSVDVSAWDMQPFWIELYAGRNADPGTYLITVRFSAEGKKAETMEIQAQVWPFSIPDRPDLETSITTKSTNPFAQPMFSERWYILEQVYGITDPDEFAQLVERYNEFLETFKIEPDLIYSVKPPTVETLLKIQNKWGLRQFNILYLPPYSMNFDLNKPETWQPQIDSILQTISTAMEQYEQAELADKAYIYGFDESNQQALAKAIFGQIKQRFPDLPIMSTYLDSSLGVNSGLAGLVDIWVPGVQAINHEAQAQAQERGDKVYWYTHVGVKDPLPNWFNGYAPSDTRVLLGPMSHKMKVDGFLYYNVARWLNHGPMNDGILSTWDPMTFPNAPGDGSLFYPGASGPIASQRIQNFRDGMEDYNLLNVLKFAIGRAKTDGAASSLLAQAETVLNADVVVTNERLYTKNAEVYREWRDQAARMIVQLITPGITLSDLEAYKASGALKQPLASQLTNHLKQAVHHHEMGQDKQASHSLSLFIQELNGEKPVASVSEEVKIRLNQDARLLVAKWQLPTE